MSGGSATMGRPLHIEYVIQSRPKVPHSFLIHTYLPTRPTRCKKCKELLRGFRQQGLQCRDCKYNACKSCVHANEIGDDCPGDIPDDDRKLTTGPSKIDHDFHGEWAYGIFNKVSLIILSFACPSTVESFLWWVRWNSFDDFIMHEFFNILNTRVILTEWFWG